MRDVIGMSRIVFYSWLYAAEPWQKLTGTLLQLGGACAQRGALEARVLPRRQRYPRGNSGRANARPAARGGSHRRGGRAESLGGQHYDRLALWGVNYCPLKVIGTKERGAVNVPCSLYGRQLSTVVAVKALRSARTVKMPPSITKLRCSFSQKSSFWDARANGWRPASLCPLTKGGWKLSLRSRARIRPACNTHAKGASTQLALY